MPKISAGLLMYRLRDNKIEFFLAHPGGPFYVKKDLGVWDLPKGEVDINNGVFEEAKREFTEETGIVPPESIDNYVELGSVKILGGKIVHAWGFESDFSGQITSNTFELEWPPHSGKIQHFPEMDNAEFFDIETARQKIRPGLNIFLDRLTEILKERQKV